MKELGRLNGYVELGMLARMLRTMPTSMWKPEERMEAADLSQALNVRLGMEDDRRGQTITSRYRC